MHVKEIKLCGRDIFRDRVVEAYILASLNLDLLGTCLRGLHLKI